VPRDGTHVRDRGAAPELARRFGVMDARSLAAWVRKAERVA
jgi:transposase-like protein